MSGAEPEQPSLGQKVCFFDFINSTFACGENDRITKQFAVLLLLRRHLRTHFSELWDGLHRSENVPLCDDDSELLRIREPLLVQTPLQLYQKCLQLGVVLGFDDHSTMEHDVKSVLTRVMNAFVPQDYYPSCEEIQLLVEFTTPNKTSFRDHFSPESVSGLSEALVLHQLEARAKTRNYWPPKDPSEAVAPSTQPALLSMMLSMMLDAWSLDYPDLSFSESRGDVFPIPEGVRVCHDHGKPSNPTSFVPVGTACRRFRHSCFPPMRSEKPFPPNSQLLRVLKKGKWVVVGVDGFENCKQPETESCDSLEESHESSESTNAIWRKENHQSAYAQRSLFGLIRKGYGAKTAECIIDWVVAPENNLISLGFLLELLRAC